MICWFQAIVFVMVWTVAMESVRLFRIRTVTTLLNAIVPLDTSSARARASRSRTWLPIVLMVFLYIIYRIKTKVVVFGKRDHISRKCSHCVTKCYSLNNTEIYFYQNDHYFFICFFHYFLLFKIWLFSLTNYFCIFDFHFFFFFFFFFFDLRSRSRQNTVQLTNYQLPLCGRLHGPHLPTLHRNGADTCFGSEYGDF